MSLLHPENKEVSSSKSFLSVSDATEAAKGPDQEVPTGLSGFLVFLAWTPTGQTHQPLKGFP